jgi:hypothetical protein
MATIDDVLTAYDLAAGEWKGCTWPTHYGNLGLDLEGISRRQGRRNVSRWRAIAEDEAATGALTADEESSLVEAALNLRMRNAVNYLPDLQGSRLAVSGHAARRLGAEFLAREWECASVWLGEVEFDARWAEREASGALQAAMKQDWVEALRHASQASAIESGYDAPRRWEGLKRVIEKVAG